MTKIPVLMLPGTGHPSGGDGVTEAFMDDLDTDRFLPSIVAYDAAYGGRAPSYADSQRSGRIALSKAMRESGADRFVIGGYSQGAVIAGDFAADVAKGLYDIGVLRPKIAGVALIADGKRPAGAGGTSKPIAPYYGIAGQRHIGLTVPTFWAAVENDPITAIPGGNPLRTVADLSEWFAIRDAQDWTRWGAEMLDAVFAGRLQDWWNPTRWHGWTGAIGYARGYLFDARHTNAYVEEGHTKALAHAINEAVS